MRRIELAGFVQGQGWDDVPDIHAVHGCAPSFGSHTIYSNADLLKQNQEAQQRNLAHHISKWGGPPGHETFQTPFNDPRKTIMDWPKA